MEKINWYQVSIGEAVQAPGQVYDDPLDTPQTYSVALHAISPAVYGTYYVNVQNNVVVSFSYLAQANRPVLDTSGNILEDKV